MNITQGMINRAWDRMTAELACVHGYVADAGDNSMRDASSVDIIDWILDLEDRVGLDVDGVRDAMWDYLDMRDSATANAIVTEAFGDGAQVAPHDPRGMFVAGAEIQSPRQIGFYMCDAGRWYVADYADNGEDTQMCDGRGNYDRAQVVAMLRRKLAA